MKVVLETKQSIQGVNCLTETMVTSYLPQLLETGFVITQDTSVELVYSVGVDHDSIYEYHLHNGFRQIQAVWQVVGIKTRFALIGWTNANDGIAQAEISSFPTFIDAWKAMKLGNEYKTQQIDFKCSNGRYVTKEERASILENLFPNYNTDCFGEFCRISFYNKEKVIVSFLKTDFIQKVFL